MRTHVIAIVIALFLSHTSLAANNKAETWQELIDTKKIAKARELCTSWLNEHDALSKAEAHKCLANVELSGASVVSVQGNDIKGGYISGSYTPEATNRALKHLVAALKFAPQDLSIHQGRLHLLEVSNRFSEMARALDESCVIYKGSDALEAWIAYTAEVLEMGQIRAGLELLTILDRHFPKSHDVIGNIGAAYSFLQEYERALPYFQRAVQLAPSDPIDTWNLGRAYDATGKNDLADEWYRKSLSVTSDVEMLRTNNCLYAKFLEEKRNDLKRACELQRNACDAKEQTACAGVRMESK